MTTCIYTIGPGKGVPCTSETVDGSNYCQPHIDFLETQREHPRGGASTPVGGASGPRGGADGPRGGAERPRGGATEPRGGAVAPPATS